MDATNAQATWERYMVVSHTVQNLNIREKRSIFVILRDDEHPPLQVFLPQLGITLSEFAVWYCIGSSKRRAPRDRQRSVA